MQERRDSKTPGCKIRNQRVPGCRIKEIPGWNTCYELDTARAARIHVEERSGAGLGVGMLRGAGNSPT